MGAGSWRWWAVVVAGLWEAAGSQAVAQQAAVGGVVVDSATGLAVPAVRVTLTGTDRRTPAAVVLTEADGRFSLTATTGTYALEFHRIGYAPLRLDGLRLTEAGVSVRVALRPVGIPLDPVVLTASRIEQSSLEAPAATSVLERAEVQAAVRSTPVDQIALLPGVDVVHKGLMQSDFAVRGGGGANSGVLLMLTDFRDAAVPSIGFNIPYLLAATREDVERIEVVRGPGAALYGPGAARGVLNVLTRAPLESPGGVVSVTGGERSLAAASFRYAARFSQRVGLAVSGDYLGGHDWTFTDTTEQRLRQEAIAAGADADTLRVGRRNPRLARAGGELQLEWQPDTVTDIRTTAGVAQAIDNIDMTSEVGAVQVQDWRYAFLQTRVRRGRLFGNAVYNTSDAGDTYVLRTGSPLVDRSRMAALQGQYGGALGSVDVRYGADLRWTDPRTGGTIDGAYENNDRTLELGGYLHATAQVGSRVELVGAARVDHHDRLNDLVLSPRAGVVYRVGSEHALRFTYNRAFTAPDPSDLFADIVSDSIRPLPYAIRAGSIPQHGYSFRRDCGGGICMRSPFAGGQYLPTDVTLLWPALVQILAAGGVDLSGVPAPSAADVSTVLAAFSPGGAIIPVTPAAIQDVPALRRTITNTLELGYKGLTAGRVWLTVDVYRNQVTDPLGDRYDLTPSVFYDPATLAQYLSNYLSPAEVAAVVPVAARIPMGTITPREALYPTDVLFVRRQGGRYTLWGADVGANAALGHGWSAAGTFSWVSSDSLASVGRVGDLVLNAPRTKGSLSLGYQGGRWRWDAAARAVSEFPVASGVYNGRVTGYGLLDASVEYRLPGGRSTLTVDGQNLLDHRHQEIVGAPALGRLVVSRLRVEF
ncbi:MAG TPA: TonB-dependent receptor [Gemmatimonadales bacterium]|nr:TonB-dependent receptor [Gemmatimonadales bacterium]